MSDAELNLEPRTHGCGELTEADADASVATRLYGWVHRRRDLGQLIFIELRDRTGRVQAVFDPSIDAELHRAADALRQEDVVSLARHGRSARGAQPRPSDGPGRDPRDEARAAEPCRVRRLRDRRRARGLRRSSPDASLPRPAPPGDAGQAAHAAPPVGRRAQGVRQRGLPRDRDADADALHAGGRARLPRSEPCPPRRVLRAAAVAAAVQAAADGVGLRALLPVRALLP